ncbi:MAG: SMI1/KNR4 family protein, partial [Planctomycetaceae bacterium]|nr:SMI1/KNR4 family protein [Planctomycetaceae bacterium]
MFTLASIPSINLLHECGLPQNAQTIAQVADSLGVRFPSSYVEFLSLCNGGRFYSPHVKYTMRNGSGEYVGTIGAFQFFTVGNTQNAPWADLMRQNKFALERYGSDLVAIGESGEDLILLQTTDGSVIFWERDKELTSPKHSNLIRVCSSLDAFFQELECEADDDERAFSVEDGEPFISIAIHDTKSAIHAIGDLSINGCEALAACCEYGE